MLAIAFAVSVASDEGGLTLFVRLGRIVPLVPLTSAVAAYAVMAGVRARGEATALGSLGVSPREISLVAAFAALVLPTLAAAALASGRVDVEGFFPPPPVAPELRVEDARFVSDDLAVSVAVDGTLAAYAPRAAGAALGRAAEPSKIRGLPGHARSAAGLTTFLVGAALALAFSRKKKAFGELVPAIACAAAVLVGFQLAAAGRFSAFGASAPALGLLAYEVRAYLHDP